MKTDLIASFSYNIYLKSIRFQKKYKIIRKISKKIWNRSLSIFANKKVNTIIHNKKVNINYGYTYPIICREFPTYNLPLVELAYLTFKNKGSSISIVDVGAAIGDTVLLLETSLPNMVKEYFCIDGDKDFFLFLKENLSSIGRASLINSFLSAKNEKAKNLVKIHPGTASAQGKEEIITTTVDELISVGKLGQFDLIKIDVDGFDGRVLLGAREALKKYTPYVIFEWHPTLCVETGNNWIDHFSSLEDCGYDRFIFFDNYGNFSHIMTVLDYEAINLLAQVCLSQKHSHAVYFDIAAIHKSNDFDLFKFAVLAYSRLNKHPY